MRIRSLACAVIGAVVIAGLGAAPATAAAHTGPAAAPQCSAKTIGKSAMWRYDRRLLTDYFTASLYDDYRYWSPDTCLELTGKHKEGRYTCHTSGGYESCWSSILGYYELSFYETKSGSWVLGRDIERTQPST